MVISKGGSLIKKLVQTEAREFIGRGRSASVYRTKREGRFVAVKTFTGDRVGKIILTVLTGAANPYTWCEDAIQTAMLRRSLLAKLCQYWFQDRLRLPQTYDYRWNETAKAFEIEMELIVGRHVELPNPLMSRSVNAMAMLKRNIMRPLQTHLIEAGIDGLVWQAGKGNPVAASNFMVEENSKHKRSYIWIDLESGLPALFALNPLSTLFYYLPKCFHHRGWLFDDVDTNKLGDYLQQHEDELCESLGPATFAQMCDETKRLAVAQQKWKSLSRTEKSLLYAVSQGDITPDEKQYFAARPFVWSAKCLLLLATTCLLKLQELMWRFIRYVATFPVVHWLGRVVQYFISSEYRRELAHSLMKREISNWRERGFLNSRESQLLEDELHSNEASASITDFSIHLATKPFVKVIMLGVAPLLTLLQITNIAEGALVFMLAGSFVRTLYTSARIIRSIANRRTAIPWLALLVGAIPIVGNLAFPLELAYQSTGQRNLLGRWLVYMLAAKFGARIPIWGGEDSEFEHGFANCCHAIIARWFPLQQVAAEESRLSHDLHADMPSSVRKS